MVSRASSPSMASSARPVPNQSMIDSSALNAL